MKNKAFVRFFKLLFAIVIVNSLMYFTSTLAKGDPVGVMLTVAVAAYCVNDIVGED